LCNWKKWLWSFGVCYYLYGLLDYKIKNYYNLNVKCTEIDSNPSNIRFNQYIDQTKRNMFSGTYIYKCIFKYSTYFKRIMTDFDKRGYVVF